MRLAVSLLGVIASALLYSLCFPPLNLAVLGWGALVPFLLVVRTASFGRVVLLSWVFTVAAAYGTGDWFPRAVATYYDQPAVVGVGFFFGVSTLTAAPFFVAFAIFYRALAQRQSPVLPLLAASAWVACELGRARLLTGDPWALFGYSQAGAKELIQIADLAGVYGVSFVLIAVNAALAEVWFTVTSKTRSSRRSAPAIVIAVVLVVSTLTYGHVRIRTKTAAQALYHPVRVAIVQANLDLGFRWRRDMYGRNLDEYLQLTLGAFRDDKPELVFWPENAMTFFLEQEVLYQKAIARVLTFGNVQLIAGGPRSAKSNNSAYYNSAFLVSPDGTILGKYDKQHLLPFAEYVPLGRLDFMRRSFGRVREFSPGEQTPPLPTLAGQAGVLICNEALFPEIVAKRVKAGADYLVNLSNDSWLNSRRFSEIALAMATFRAVEQQRYLVRASTSGPSAIVNSLGQILVRTSPLSRAVIVGSIRPSKAVTIYNRVGDLFAGACAAILLAALLSPPLYPSLVKLSKRIYHND